MNMNYKPNDVRGDRRIEGTVVSESPHMLILDGRSRLEVTGVRDVIRFDELSAELSTSLGDLVIEGEGLRIAVFDTEKGIVTLNGEIRTLDYYDGKSGAENTGKKRGFFGKR